MDAKERDLALFAALSVFCAVPGLWITLFSALSFLCSV